MNSYLELLKANSNLKQQTKQHNIEMVVLNNITTNPIKDYLEYSCALNGIAANITFGDYDNIVQNAQEFDLEHKAVIVFWELVNCVHGLEYKIDSFSPDFVESLEKKIQTELLLAFDAFSKASMVIMNRFTGMAFSYMNTQTSALEALAARLNLFCEQQAPKSIKWVTIDKCLMNAGIENTIDYKGYLKNKLLYKHQFYWTYVQLIQPYFNAFTGQVNKLLALDCDNTLWSGILGEDGAQHIDMDENTYKGQAFAAAQFRALGLGNKGVLLALASKNNPEDVDGVLNTHDNIVINDNALVAKKVNWNPKGENLQQLSQELNIGVDSFVFVDDSDFEVQMMRDQMPSVKTIQVPKNAVQYYIEQMQWSNHFVQLNESEEDQKKLDQYKQNVQRADAEKKFDNFEGFLKSLELQLTIYKNHEQIVPRMAQMTQKTNQFNLTTQRYTDAQIEQFVSSDAYDCFAFGVQDKFGDNGITGLCIIHYLDDSTAAIDSLLMSCRILGRTIEYQFMDEVLAQVFSKVELLKADYLESKKNAQVSDFYDKIGFKLLRESEGQKSYSKEKNTFKSTNAYNYIKVNHV